MPSLQRYVSNELTHFVGRSLPNNDDRYGLLLKILGAGWLTHPPHKPEPTGWTEVTFDPGRIMSDDICTVDSVCFCDIPVADLHIHMEKYSHVGLSFSKAFLVDKGANPVFYVARNGPVGVVDQTKIAKRYEEYRSDAKAWCKEHGAPFEVRQVAKECTDVVTRGDHLRDVLNIYSRSVTKTLSGMAYPEKIPLVSLYDSMTRDFFSYLKPFDTTHVDDDEKNYYMEREWRVTQNVQFSLADVERIILPNRGFGRRFRTDVPAFDGQVTFVE